MALHVADYQYGCLAAHCVSVNVRALGVMQTRKLALLSLSVTSCTNIRLNTLAGQIKSLHFT